MKNTSYLLPLIVDFESQITIEENGVQIKLEKDDTKYYFWENTNHC